jgi:hypothetical protein
VGNPSKGGLPGALKLTVLVGTDPAASDVVCPELAEVQATRVALGEPMGARRVVFGGP